MSSRTETSAKPAPAGAPEELRTADYIRLEEQYGAHNYHPLDVVISRG